MRHLASGVVVVEFDQVIEILVLRSTSGEIFREPVFEFELQNFEFGIAKLFQIPKTSHRRASPPRFLHRVESRVHDRIDLRTACPKILVRRRWRRPSSHRV
jgi:hypothetical protein